MARSAWSILLKDTTSPSMISRSCMQKAKSRSPCTNGLARPNAISRNGGLPRMSNVLPSRTTMTGRCPTNRAHPAHMAVLFRSVILMRRMPMLSAQNDQGKEVQAEAVEWEDGPFYCPGCGEEVILKQAPIKIPHFSPYPERD